MSTYYIQYLILHISYYTFYTNYAIYEKRERLIAWGIDSMVAEFLYCILSLAVSTVLMWLADLGSRSDGGSNHSISKYLRIFLVHVTIIRIMHLIQIMTHIVSGYCPPWDIGAARIGKTQGPFFTVQLFGAGAHQVQGCAAGLLQSVSVENVLWKSSHGPRHDSAAGHR